MARDGHTGVNRPGRRRFRLTIHLQLFRITNPISHFFGKEPDGGKPMKKMILTLIAVLAASPVMAGSSVSPLNELVLSAPSISGEQHGDARRKGERRPSPSMGSDAQLDGELPASDVFSLADAPDLEEFVLKLPESELPDSDIPLTVNSKVSYFVTYFQTSARSAFAKWLSRSERYIPMMKELLKKEGMPEDLVYLAMIESGFSPHAYSVASAVGPWQFMSGTGKRYSLRIDQWVDERRDPVKSTIAAAMYLKELYSLFNKDWYLAAAGYNAGENKILRAISMYNTRDFWRLSQGGYLKRETKDYVPKLLAAAIIAKEPAKYGFADVAYLPPMEYDTVRIPSQTDLELTASICGVPVETIKTLNPELRRWCTPPGLASYELKLPKGKKELFEREYAHIPPEKRFVERVAYAWRRAGRRDTLNSIARRFGTTPEVLAELNGLKKGQRLKGKLLKIPVQTASAEAAKSADKAAAEPVSKEFKKYYVVRKGDTVHSLSRRFNVSARLLTAWNNLKARSPLRPGKRIIIARYLEKKGGMLSDG